ncbi:hypothetical protein IMCC20628_01702 [Hoeflea sp. IMCC20628]|uniref:hypothetical protein n=1 Tax=Hoeflea sp. IMCC20628 TaxID=1620421 RepID=UPI00063AE589|nr:hypothetical protein [Hoeflea sp. IMCC20628]AKI00416.1 hypothetical protein IMCC20628_01702 [Hoeflea sp. IMCC20628]
MNMLIQPSTQPSASPGRQFRIVGLNLAVILIVLTAAVVTPRQGKAVVFVPPWSEPGRVLEVIAAAGGSVLNGTGKSYAVIAQSDQPWFAFRLFQSGAMLVLDGSLSFLCRSTPST